MKPLFNRFIGLSALAALAAAPALAAKGEPVAKPFAAHNACQYNERWTFGAPGTVRADFAADFQAFLDGKLQPVQGFAGGMALRRYGQFQEARVLGEYWVSRSLLASKLPHIAFAGFGNIVSRPPTAETAGVQLAALDCMLHIQAEHPALALPASVVSRLDDLHVFAKAYPTQSGARIIWEAAAAEIRAKLGQTKGVPADLDHELALVKGGGAFENLSRGLIAARRGEHAQVSRKLSDFLAAAPMPAPLARFADTAHLEIARSDYALGEFDQAASQFKQISRSSNDLAESLSELSWAYLMNERYAETIGTAMNLQAGGLRHTYAPEGPMVMAMALNELCQYPESVRATNLFRKLYEETYRWLARWQAAPPDKREALYPKAVAYIKRLNQAPRRLAGEWVRSPVFISSQDEINLIFDEGGETRKLGKSGSVAQTTIGAEVIRLAAELKPRIHAFRQTHKHDRLPKDVIEGLHELKREIALFRQMQGAAPIWRKVLANYQHGIVGTEKALMARIEQDLRERSQRMFNQLEEVAENIQLIEVEIYNGASQDIIWQNAHPDYKEIATQLKADHERAQREKVWDWGRAPAGSEENAEIWEDELGSFKANLYDNCSSKDRYLAIKMHKGRMTAHE